MSGITGIISNSKEDFQSINILSNKIKHRGPDNQFVYKDDNTCFALNHLKLSNCDFKKNNELLFLNRYIVLLDGQIYNVNELKTILSKEGYSSLENNYFEIIAYVYDRFGPNCLKMFNGIWSLVIYDLKRKNLFISRDRLGVKPLFYYQSDELFIFSSELKGVLAHPKVKYEVNQDWCINYVHKGLYFLNNNKDTDFSPYDNIREFQANTYTEISIKDIFHHQLSTHTFYEFNVNHQIEKFKQNKFNEYSEHFKYLLEEAVKLRIPENNNVFVGTGLGGVDSSVLAYLSNKNIDDKDRYYTFSSVHKSPETKYCDESYYIDIVNKYLNLNNKQIDVKTETVLNEHRKVIQMMDIPPACSCLSAWNTYKLMSDFAQDKRIISLDGQGADALLAGNLYYLVFYLYPFNTLQSIKESFQYIQHSGAIKIITKSILFKVFKHLEHKPESLKKYFNSYKDINDLNSVCKKDLTGNLKLLYYYCDKESMAFSVESRAPYTDYRLIDFVLDVPSVYKFHQGWPKYLIRKSFEDKLPKEIVWQKKKNGWDIPDKYWFGDLYKQRMIDLISKCDFTQNIMLKANLVSMPDDYNYLLRLYNLSLWYKANNK